MAMTGFKHPMKTRSRFKHIKPKTATMLSLKGPPSKTFLLCRPSFYGIEYEINPWMKLGVGANQQKAIEQWDSLCDRIKEFNGEVVNIIPQPGLPDMVFTANGGLFLKGKNAVVLPTFKHPERQKEQWWFHEFFMNRNVQSIITYHDFEGAGDALFLGETLIGGYGFRSQKEAYDEIRHYLDQEAKVVKLVNPYFYHLDTCFCPLRDMDYLIYPDAFDAEGLESIRSLGGNEIVVPEKEAKLFACNSVQIDNNVIIPKNCPETSQLLQDAGYNPIPVDVSEFLKAGGACKCLTLEIS